jgi:hypothetical protein
VRRGPRPQLFWSSPAKITHLGDGGGYAIVHYLG